MTYEEYKPLMTALWKKFPYVYRREKQIEIAFHVSGLSLAWFKERWNYVYRSRDGRYDWIAAANAAKKRAITSPDIFALVQKLGLDPQKLIDEIEDSPDFHHLLEVSRILGGAAASIRDESIKKTYKEFLEDNQAGSALDILENEIQKRRQGETP
ncbi:hypothetical protein [Bdellovibrio bacteriovorus]|uniref:hypothetical protein n=1 Tax=Bdellovibrio bacteriovorus TaxID=959 RepID=UPI0035A57645